MVSEIKFCKYILCVKFQFKKTNCSIPIKILVISNWNHFVATRPEAEEFLALDRKEFEVTVMTYKGSVYADIFEQRGYRVIDFQPESKFDRRGIAFIRNELIAGKYDILQLFTSKAITAGIFAARGLPVKVVLYRGYTVTFRATP